ncbi:unnamed protein product [Meloidogyne enterolobii]|uniref:Uncharacterized protein n=1 Tax=Meloidogyne enterolobii TaxID=390850 RepID=A0ACB1AF86_MELEN
MAIIVVVCALDLVSSFDGPVCCIVVSVVSVDVPTALMTNLTVLWEHVCCIRSIIVWRKTFKF